jgi:hypothetical protein
MSGWLNTLASTVDYSRQTAGARMVHILFGENGVSLQSIVYLRGVFPFYEWFAIVR